MTAREAACSALIRVEQGKKSNEVVGEILTAGSLQDPRDRALFTRLVLGTLQNRLFIDQCIDNYSNTPLAKMKPFIRNLLRMSAYQLGFLDSVPASAVCNEAVKLARKRGFASLAGFVNAVCRKLAGSVRELYQKCEDPALKYSLPQWIAEELTELAGKDEAASVMEAFQKETAPLTARFNLSKASRQEILNRLALQGIHAEPAPYSGNAWYLKDHPAPPDIAAFAFGLIQYQDLTSILAVEALGIRKGEQILDLCAAPGGKTIAAADLTGPTGKVIACDISEVKLDKIRENASRCGFDNIVPTINDAAVFRPEWEKQFDAVIADLPCSGLGTISHKPEVRYRVTPEDVTALALLQRSMLVHAVRYLKTGGRLLFSTCTFARQENVGNTLFLRDHPELEPLEPAIPSLAKGQNAVRLLPHLYDVHDGFYISCFRRR